MQEEGKKQNCVSENLPPSQEDLPAQDNIEKNGARRKPEEGLSLREEMKSCFYEWTQEQLVVLENLSTAYMTKLDETCLKILAALNLNLKEQRPPALHQNGCSELDLEAITEDVATSSLSDYSHRYSCSSRDSDMNNAFSVTKLSSVDEYSSTGNAATEEVAKGHSNMYAMSRSQTSRFRAFPEPASTQSSIGSSPPRAGTGSYAIERTESSKFRAYPETTVPTSVAKAIHAKRSVSFDKMVEAGHCVDRDEDQLCKGDDDHHCNGDDDLPDFTIQKTNRSLTSKPPEVVKALREQLKSADKSAAARRKTATGRSSMTTDVTAALMPSRISTIVDKTTGVSIPLPNNLQTTGRKSFAMQESIDKASPGLLSSVVAGPRGNKRWSEFTAVAAQSAEISISSIEFQATKYAWFQQCVRSTGFDLLCAFVIVLFMIILGIETNDAVRRGGNSSETFLVISLCFNAWFTAELFIRIAAERCSFFVGQDAFMNNMDVILVATSVADLFIGLVLEEKVSLQTDIVARFMRIIRVLRAARIVRLVRVMRYIYQLRKMVCLIQSCFNTLFWMLLIMVAFVYTFAVLFTQGVFDYIVEFQGEEGSTPAHIETLYKHYGSVEKSMNSLFQTMSTGVSWGIVFEPLTQTGWLYPTFFISFVALALFGILNIMTSVFVESTMKSALAYRDLIITDSERSKQTAVRHLHEVFNDIDVDGNGRLSLDEVLLFLGDANVYTYMEALDINLHDARTLFQLIDTDGSGAVDIDEFCDGCLRLKGAAKAFDIHCLICELSRFFDKWSSFTEFTVNKFDSIEARLKNSRVFTNKLVQASRQHQRPQPPALSL